MRHEYILQFKTVDLQYVLCSRFIWNIGRKMLPVKVTLISANTTQTALSMSSATLSSILFAERFIALIEPLLQCGVCGWGTLPSVEQISSISRMIKGRISISPMWSQAAKYSSLWCSTRLARFCWPLCLRWFVLQQLKLTSFIYLYIYIFFAHQCGIFQSVSI